METRILKTKLGDALSRQLQHHSKAALADRIGVSPQKLTAMMCDQWEYITRDALERVTDFLNLDVNDVFELVPVDFWKPIEDAQGSLLLGGEHESVKQGHHYTIPRYDDEATYVVKDFMRKSLLGCDNPPLVALREGELLARAKTQNCIVVGSPKTNVATEILLSRFFDAEPFDDSLENRKTIPFGFCWPDDNYLNQKSSLTCSPTMRALAQHRPGISVIGGPFVAADYKPPQQFRSWITTEGLDCGLVFVANRPFNSKHNVKLIVLAGFGGMGTLAAAKALVGDFRYLEPVGNETYVFGIVEAKYRKRPDTNARELRTFRWKYRQGGHSPIR